MKQPFQVSNLVCSGRSVIVGSSAGSVAIFDSETANVLRFFSWHKDKVRMLLLMPPQMEPCVSAEVPFPDQDWNDIEKSSSPYGMGSPAHQKDRKHHSPKMKRANGQVRDKNFFKMDSDQEQEMFEPESCLVTSIGNGKCGYSVNLQSKEDQIQIFDREARKKMAYKKGSRIQSDDIVLRIWKT